MAKHFGVGVKDNQGHDPLVAYTRHWERFKSGTGLQSSQDRLESVEKFWMQYNVSLISGSVQREEAANTTDPNCLVLGDEKHHLAFPHHWPEFEHSEQRHVMSDAMRRLGYQVPQLSVLKDALNSWRKPKTCPPQAKPLVPTVSLRQSRGTSAQESRPPAYRVPGQGKLRGEPRN